MDAGPTPGSNAFLQITLMRALAQRSEQVLLMTPLPDGGVPTKWLMSVPGAPPIQHLQNGWLLNHTPDGYGIDQTANFVTPPDAGWLRLDSNNDICPEEEIVAVTRYPQLYWACGNDLSVNLYSGGIRWVLRDQSFLLPTDAIEVYLR